MVSVETGQRLTEVWCKLLCGCYVSEKKRMRLYPSHSILTRANPDFYLVQILSIGCAKSEIKLKIYDLLWKKVDSFLYFFMPGDLEFTTHFTCLAW